MHWNKHCAVYCTVRRFQKAVERRIFSHIEPGRLMKSHRNLFSRSCFSEAPSQDLQPSAKQQVPGAIRCSSFDWQISAMLFWGGLRFASKTLNPAGAMMNFFDWGLARGSELHAAVIPNLDPQSPKLLIHALEPSWRQPHQPGKTVMRRDVVKAQKSTRWSSRWGFDAAPRSSGNRRCFHHNSTWWCYVVAWLPLIP